MRGDAMQDQDFVWRRRVGFADCDPARIAYTGRIPDFALEAIDAFWEKTLDGINWFRLNVDLGFATPFVHLRFDFKAPVTPRAPLECRVVPTRLGTTSIGFRVTGEQAGVVCFVGDFVCVVSSSEFAKTPVPDWMRDPLVAAYPSLLAAD